VEDNAAAADVKLTARQIRTLNEALPPGAATGDRYVDAGMQAVNR
jgi:hypothetical protein